MYRTLNLKCIEKFGCVNEKGAMNDTLTLKMIMERSKPVTII